MSVSWNVPPVPPLRQAGPCGAMTGDCAGKRGAQACAAVERRLARTAANGLLGHATIAA